MSDEKVQSKSVLKREAVMRVHAGIDGLLGFRTLCGKTLKRAPKPFARVTCPACLEGGEGVSYRLDKGLPQDLVTYEGRRYSLADLGHYLDDEFREALHFGWDGDADDYQGWWDEYVRRYPEDAAHAAACAPVY